MTIELLSIVGCFLLSLICILYFIRRWITELSVKTRPNEELLVFLQSTNQRMDEQGRQISDRLDTAARYIGEVQKNIGEMSEIGRSMKQFQELMQSPKLRGNIGEHILRELLGQMLPKQAFYMQHTYRSGVIVDAAIKTANGIIPIDSKFPLDNFRKLNAATTDTERKQYTHDFERDVKKHIDDIAKKYISHEDGTIDYALMYLPSEAVFYEVVNNAALFDYAGEKRILPVSPMTMYAYLRTILMSFEGQKIEQQAKEILVMLRGLKKDYAKVEDGLSTLNRHIGNAYNQMGNVHAAIATLGKKLMSTETIAEKQEESAKELEHIHQ
jgi:DNA recombination protein RmuC